MPPSTLEQRATEPPTEAPARARLAWLDVLRGLAALAVALHHATYYFTPRLRYQVFEWFDPGRYGVLVFFLVSGYVVPASLERHGRVRDFWIGRFFRIHPLLLVASVLGIVPFILGIRGLRAGLEQYDPVIATLAHVTMLQDVLAVPNTLNVLWTLSYEMVFYLLIVALFVTGTHRRSAPIAALLVLAALLGGAVLPTAVLSRAAGTGRVVVIAAVLLAVAIAAAASSRARPRTAGGILGGVLAAVLVTVNGRITPWEGLVILAVMFAGTVVYRAQHGQIGKGAAALGLATVLAGSVAAGVWSAARTMPRPDAHVFQVYWTGSVLLAAFTFAGVMALRHRRMPRSLVGLGVISYSVYLLHPVLLIISDQLGGTPERDDVLRLAVFVCVLVMVSWTTHRCVEAPMQRLGRRVARRLGSGAARHAPPSGGDRSASIAAGAPGASVTPAD
ncbi:acyltransferase family protein [Actinomadura sp. HBU206391]|uniref:acyltransferase family protein n=1 Tax=Actinomadura sp. HBU206391 TaxID=2731692 RepID=UPI001650C680|nr:acyltransferase [Actinomadura sp. HBU206391]MBC6457860.1 acyltransferase [Actinomadura sp. HBU206391]